MDAVWRLFLSLHLCWLSTCVLVSGKVPVLVWTNSRLLEFPQQLAGHSTSQQEFKQSIGEWISDQQNNVVLFLQEKLGVLDFTHFSDVYGANSENDSFSHLKSIMSQMSSTYLPSVASPSSVLMDIRHEKERKVHIIDDPYHMSSLTADGDANNRHLFIVKLPEMHHSEKAFSHIDKIFDLVTSKVKLLAIPFVAFYTASGPGHHQSSFMRIHHQGRKTLSVKELAPSEAFVNVSGTFFLYSRNISIVSNDTKYHVTLATNADDGSTCSDTGSCVIYLKFADVTALKMTNPKLMLELNETTGPNSGFWYVSQMQLKYTGQSGEVAINYRISDFVEQTPKGYSYHCSAKRMISVSNSSSGDFSLKFTFDAYQIQAFGIYDDKFGHYNDCVGFFTIGIWMFLIVTAILIAILLFGIIMLSNITTPDRFDDPKGKTITVTVAE